MICRALILSVVIAQAGDARASPEVENEKDPTPLRLIVLTSGAIVHFVTDYVIEDLLAPDRCRWCVPPGFDASVRDRVVWDNRTRAARLSDATGYVALPLVSAGLFAIAARDVRCPGRRFFHDAVPILESAVYTQLFAQIAKFSVGRQRPDVHFDGTGVARSEDNLSFYSGHTTLAFSLAVSSGFVARRRGYAIERPIWISTLALAATTAYLRLAGDRHYLSDVLVGAAVGTAGGYLIPHVGGRLGDRAAIVPTSNGIALAGTW